MNLVAKEYVACQRDVPACAARRAERDGPGVLILSEFAGAAQELPDALTVNPYDVPGVADAIAQALAMPADERRRRMKPMRDRVSDARRRGLGAGLPPRARRPARRRSRRRRRGRRWPRRGGCWPTRSPTARRVAMFLDYDGTLREIVRDPAAAGPTPEAPRPARAASPAQPNVDLTVISGRTAADLTAFLGERPEFGLVAEHGAELRAPGAADWQQLDHNLDLGWKHQAFRILELYARSTPGTHVEDKRTGVVWHYRQADPEFGKWKANQLVDELSIVVGQPPGRGPARAEDRRGRRRAREQGRGRR